MGGSNSTIGWDNMKRGAIDAGRGVADIVRGDTNLSDISAKVNKGVTDFARSAGLYNDEPSAQEKINQGILDRQNAFYGGQGYKDIMAGILPESMAQGLNSQYGRLREQGTQDLTGAFNRAGMLNSTGGGGYTGEVGRFLGDMSQRQAEDYATQAYNRQNMVLSQILGQQPQPAQDTDPYAGLKNVMQIASMII